MEKPDHGKTEDTRGYEKSPEVEAFVERFNYFRKPFAAWLKNGSGWREVKLFPSGEPAYAGDWIVQNALDGRGDISMRLSRTTTFFVLDLDPVMKGKKDSQRQERSNAAIEYINVKSEVSCSGEELLTDDKGAMGSSQPEPHISEDEKSSWRNWEGWKEYVLDPVLNEQIEAMPAIEVAVPSALPAAEGINEEDVDLDLNGELLKAARLLLGLLTEVPSLVRKSPHGLHLYWCLEEPKVWTTAVQPLLVQVKRQFTSLAKNEELGFNVELLPRPSKPLRIPRKDMLLDPRTLEAMESPIDGIAFWRGLRRYRLEDLIRPESWMQLANEGEDKKLRQSRSENSRDAPLRNRGSGTRGIDSEILRLKPKDHVEAEALLMPFRNNQSNSQLTKLVEGGKREGMSLGDIIVWILGWKARSIEAGYVGDLFDDENVLVSRIKSLYKACRVAGASRFIELWEREEGKYPRNEVAAGRSLARLEATAPQPTRSRKAVQRFLTNLEAWRRIVDDAVADPASGIDVVTRENQKREVYPLPYDFLRHLYNGHGRIWRQLQEARIVLPDEEDHGRYVPVIGRPQYYSLVIR
jgi:hypothetical protein